VAFFFVRTTGRRPSRSGGGECGPSRRKGSAGEEHGAEPVRSRGVAGHLPGAGGRAQRRPSSWRRRREAPGTSVGKSRARAGRGNDRTDF
jgi:hypothetical protein